MTSRAAWLKPYTLLGTIGGIFRILHTSFTSLLAMQDWVTCKPDIHNIACSVVCHERTCQKSLHLMRRMRSTASIEQGEETRSHSTPAPLSSVFPISRRSVLICSLLPLVAARTAKMHVVMLMALATSQPMHDLAAAGC